MPEHPLDPFDAGFDVFPDISIEDALDEQFNGEISDVAQGIDELMNGVNGFVASELNDVSNTVAEIRGGMFDAVDEPLQEIQSVAGDFMLALEDIANGEIESITEEMQPIISVAVNCGLLPPPNDPWNGLSAQACAFDTGTFEDREAYMVQLFDWLLLVDVPAFEEMSEWYTTRNPSSCGGKSMSVCGFDIGGYQGQNEAVIPGPEPELDCMGRAIIPGVDRFAGLDLTGWCADTTGACNENTLQFTPAFSGAGYGMVDGFDNVLAVLGDNFSIPRIINLYVPCDPDVIPPGPIIPPEQIEPPEPPIELPPIEGLIEKLCECLNRDTGKKLEVWVHCETCKIDVLSPDDASLPRELPWRKVVTINEQGEATYLEQCPQPEGNGQPRVPQPQVPEGLDTLIQGVCNMPVTLSYPPDVQVHFSVATFSAAVAFTALSLIPTFILLKVKPDGAMLGLAALLAMMGRSAEFAAGAADKLECGPRVKGLIFARQFMGLMERVLPGGFQEHIARQTQSINEMCPSLLPTLAQAHGAFLRGDATIEQWKCWVRANGYMDDSQFNILRSMRTKPGVNELSILLRRGDITQAEWNKMMIEVGVLDAADRLRLFSLSEQRPGMQDIIRFMVRDTDDDVNIDWTESDATFLQKFRGQLRRWAEDQGVPEKVALYAWRAHWVIPSPTQLFEMLHRLGRNPDGSVNQQFLTEIKGALQQQDILPKWVDRFIQISFRLPTRVDMRRAYRIGAVTEDQVFDLFVKSGYDKTNAKALTEFSTREKLVSWSNHILVKAFSRGELSEEELRTELAGLLATPDAIDFAVHWGRGLLLTTRRKRCLAAIRRKVFVGEVDKAQAVALVLLQNTDQLTAAELVESWFCERDAGSREITIRQVMRLFSEQIIDAPELFRRLINLRYNTNDAQVLVDRGIKVLARSIASEEQKRLDKAQRAAEKAQKDAARTADQAEKAAARTEKARKASIIAEESREKRVTNAAKTLSNRMNVSLNDLVGPMMTTYRSIVRAGIETANQTSAMTLVAAGDRAAVSLETWESILRALIASTIDNNGQ